MSTKPNRAVAMKKNTFGNLFQVHSFGESHGKAVGLIIDGCPSGVKFCLKTLQDFVNRRRPGFSLFTSKRKEKDLVHLLSGVYKNKTLGTPIAMMVYNTDARPKDYDKIKTRPRPGHADDIWKNKYKHIDHRGGGRASARETLSRVMAGAVAQMLIKYLAPKLEVISFIKSVGPHCISQNCFDKIIKQKNAKKKLQTLNLSIPDVLCLAKVKKLLTQASASGESYGGVITVVAKNPPAGLGQPVFSKLKSDLASGLLSIGSTAGIEFGAAFKESAQKGSQFHSKKQTHNYAGLRGGISTGDDLIINLTFKPVSSIGFVAKNGRHDACVLQRALPIVESMLLLSLADHLLFARLDKV